MSQSAGYRAGEAQKFKNRVGMTVFAKFAHRVMGKSQLSLGNGNLWRKAKLGKQG